MLTLGGSNMSKLLLQMSVQCGQYDSYLSNYSAGGCCDNSYKSNRDTTSYRHLDAGGEMASVSGDHRRLKGDNIYAGPGRKGRPGRRKAFQVEELYISRSPAVGKLSSESSTQKAQES